MRLTNAPPESTVATLWERQLFASGALEALDLSVIYRGVPCDSGGPDYRDALLAHRDGRLIRGDIEFHVRASDWYAHGHHLDPNYNRVVLHVVWLADADGLINQAGERIPVAPLAEHAILDPARRAGQRFALMPHRCGSALGKLSGPELRHSLRRLGHARLQARADRMGAEIAADGADQALYANLLQALGFAGNQEGFRRLAEAVHLSWLVSLPPDRRTDCLLSAAGFAHRPSPSPPCRLPIDVWRLARLRPANHPIRRIAAVAPLLARFSPGFAAQAVDAVLSCRRGRDLPRLLTVKEGTETWVGAGRATEMTASVLLPFAYAWTGDTRAVDLLLDAPAPPPTRWTRALLGLLPYPFAPRNAAEHQGMHELYVNHCRGEGRIPCEVCAPGLRFPD